MKNTIALTDGIPPTARNNLPPAACCRDGHCFQSLFAFSKKQQKQERKDGDKEWQSIIWKQKSSAVESDVPP